MNNEKGGIISTLLIIPIGVVLMAAFFLLGYYVGKYQCKSGFSGDILPPLPEVSSGTSTRREEYTFFKTLTDNHDKTVSFDLKSKSKDEERKPVKQQASTETVRKIPVPSAPKDKRIAVNLEKETPGQMKSRQSGSDQSRSSSQKETARASSSGKLRYTVQTASYPEKEMAEDQVRNLKRRGYAAFIASSELPGKRIWYRVRLGSFSSRAAAEKLQKAVHAKEGISSIIAIE